MRSKVTKLLCSIWLLLLTITVVQASFSPTFGYDGQPTLRTTYDRASSLSLACDETVSLTKADQQRHSVFPDDLFCQFSKFLAAEGTTTLYRAVGPSELADIQTSGAFQNLGSAEGKYFTTSSEAASSYAQQAVRGFGDPPYTTIQTTVPNSIFNGLSPATVDGGIDELNTPTNSTRGANKN